MNFSVVALNTQTKTAKLITPTSNRPPPSKNVCKNWLLILPGGAVIQLTPVNYAKIFLALGVTCTLCTPWLRPQTALKVDSQKMSEKI